MITKSLVFSESSSDKFWNITLDGTKHTVEYGRVGTNGQSQEKSFGTEDEAKKSFEKLIAEKVKKGYTEAASNGTSSPVGIAETAAANGSASSASSSTVPVAVTASASQAASTVKTAKATKATKAKVEEDEEASAEPLVLPDDPTPLIALDPQDWQWATWRKRVPLEKPVPAPFDIKEAAKRLAKIPTNWRWEWEKANIASFLSREEAHFWWAAMTPNQGKTQTPNTARALAAHLEQQTFSGDVSPSVITNYLAQNRRSADSVIFPVLAGLLTARQLAELFLDDLIQSHWYYQTDGPMTQFKTDVLPYLSESEWDELRELARDRLTGVAWPVRNQYGNHGTIPNVFFLAAYVGLHDEIRALVESWPDDEFGDISSYSGGEAHYLRVQEIVFGLESGEAVETQSRRLKLPPFRSSQIRGWLAHTGSNALDMARDAILTLTGKEEAATLIETLALARVPETAPIMLELMQSSRAPRPARQWLDTYRAHAITGLIPVAVGRGKMAEAALEYLRERKRAGEADKIEAALAGQTPEIAEKIRALVLDREEKTYPEFDESNTPDWLRDTAAKTWPAGANWIQASNLPPIVVGPHRLNATQVAALISALIKTKPDALTAPTLDGSANLIAALRREADRNALDAFAWKLFQAWLSEGAPSAGKWALLAIGLLGNDISALKLTPLVRAWPGESQHNRAVTGLEVLRAIGTDTALMQINGIAQKVSFKGLKAKAQECMEAIARDRNLSREELEDRIVPDCELDDRGTRTLDFGPRQFQIVLGQDIKPMVRDASGTIKPDLPKPNVKDDAEKAAAAIADWKLLKKQIADAVKIQNVRLEQAMVTGRHWPITDFELLLARHPLMTNLSRLLVWGAYNGNGELTATFRVTEDQTYADRNDDAFTLDGVATVGIVHPMALREDDRAVWGEMLSDYEIVPPFPQLGRPVYTLEPGDSDQIEITRFANIGKIPAITLVGMLDKMGWQRGIPQDAGIFGEHTKPFHAANVTAVVEYPGVPIGYMEGWDEQTIDRCVFVQGINPRHIWDWRKHAIPLNQVDPIVVSEVLRDLNALASKAK